MSADETSMSDPATQALNVLRQPLQVCSLEPKTGYRRDGSCSSGPDDLGRHLLCAQVTAAFLEFSRSRGNDLVTPVPPFDFPGLRPGDRWCLCVDRWLEALEAGVAPPVVLEATHEGVLRNVELEILKRHALVAE
jgi:uncharacterized protein (DUF2237 family)